MDQPKILVAIRKRPLSKKEENKGQTDIISVKNNQAVIVSEYKQKVDLTKYLEETVFNFDFAFHENTNNQEIYESAVRPLVESAFQGAKVTCFAYGQTGSGKTFTMNGNSKMGVRGLYALGAQDIFSYLADPNFQHLKARLSFFEIYCGKLFDLLNKRQELKILEDKKNNINIIGLEETHITSWEQFLQLLDYGSTQRITSQNSANSQSSRSHAILQISLKDGKKLFGKISFIDLAGNERGADHTDMKKQTRIDGAQINKSLLSLKECIRALDQGKGHTPFRGSKLTMVLKDSFTGFCRTLMIGNVSPSSACSENTLNTLRYADRVKQLRKPTQNISKQELKAKQMMLPRQNKNVLKINIENDDDAEDIEAKRHAARGNMGLKEQKNTRERSNDPYIIKQEEQRPRQQSFGYGKNQMKLSQNLEGKKQKLTQVTPQPPPPKQIKQPNTANTAKINMVGNNKKPMFNEKPTLPRSNSMQPELPRPGFQNKNSADMDIEEQYYPNNGSNMKGKQMNNFISNQSTNYSSNTKLGHQFEVKNIPLLQKNNSEVLNFRSNNPPQNYQMPNSQFFSNNQAHKPFVRNQQQTVIPNDWNGMDQYIKNCNDDESVEVVKERMHQILFNEENDLMSNHSDSLRSSLDIIKSEMNMLGALQNDKDTLTTREYIRFMEQSIDEKISILEMLREKMAQFSYKLDTMEQIEETGNFRKGDDEQLLDDLP